MLSITSKLSTPDVLKSLDEDGFAVIANVISPEVAAEIAELTLRCPTRSPGVQGWEAYLTLLNFDLRFASLTACPPVLEIVRQLLGGRTEAQANTFLAAPNQSFWRLNLTRVANWLPLLSHARLA